MRYEVQKALALKKPIFAVVLEGVASSHQVILDLGLPEHQQIEKFTDETRWVENMQRLLNGLIGQGLIVTRHDRRRQPDRHNPHYTLYQTYLRRLVEDVGGLKLAQINPEQPAGVLLEEVYVDSPTGPGP